jgi:hypothetical protein
MASSFRFLRKYALPDASRNHAIRLPFSFCIPRTAAANRSYDTIHSLRNNTKEENK